MSDARVFLTPAELCERWRIDARTLDKLSLPWFVVRSRVRRIALDIVLDYERRHRLTDWTTCPTK